MFRILRRCARTGLATLPLEPARDADYELAGEKLLESIRRLRGGRSLYVREVDAGSCNGCEIEISALTSPVYDAERFGVHVTASPRHADVLLVTGPVTRQMELALKMTYEAAPEPKIVVACGDCALDGGAFAGSYAVAGAVEDVLPVDIRIKGCPPKPSAILGALLAAVERAGKA